VYNHVHPLPNRHPEDGASMWHARLTVGCDELSVHLTEVNAVVGHVATVDDSESDPLARLGQNNRRVAGFTPVGKVVPIPFKGNQRVRNPKINLNKT
jgi:hypothetical protein